MNKTLAANINAAAVALKESNERKVAEGIVALAAKCNNHKVRVK